MPSPSDLGSGSAEVERLVDLAERLAREAGALLVDRAGRVHDVSTKSSATDPVSEVDRRSEQLIMRGILDARPDDGVLGEEDAGNRPGTSGLRWVVDPLDGTVNYLYGIPAWCVSIACEDASGGLVAVVYDPGRDEMFSARRGGGAVCNGESLRVNEPADLSRSLIGTGFAYGPQARAAQGRWAADLLQHARDIRRAGAAALDLAWTATGRLDGFYEWGLSPWDFAAGLLLVEEAGGVTSTRELLVDDRRAPLVFAGSTGVHDALTSWFDGLPGSDA